MTPPQAAVIIPHYRDLARLRLCLASLVPQADDRIEIVVIDNDSGIDMTAIQGEFPMIRFLTETEKGAAPARNRGVAESTAPLLFFIDADCIAAPDWIETALSVAPRAALTGGRVDLFDETPGPRNGAEAFETVFAFHQRAYVEQKGFSVTANLVTSRAVFEDTGGFINGVSEDKEWCQRATARGHALVYRDELAVSHPTRSDYAALVKKWRRTTEESFLLAQSRGGPVRLKWLAFALVVAASAGPHALAFVRSRTLRGMGERARGIATLARLRLSRAAWMTRQALSGTARLSR